MTLIPVAPTRHHRVTVLACNQPDPALWVDPVAMYKHVDEKGELLYIGISNDPVRRWHQHRETSLWAPFTTHIYLVWYRSRAEAQRAEAENIRRQAPVFNTARPGTAAEHNARKIRYLRTGDGGGLRGIECRTEKGAWCVVCGDEDRYYDMLAEQYRQERTERVATDEAYLLRIRKAAGLC